MRLASRTAFSSARRNLGVWKAESTTDSRICRCCPASTWSMTVRLLNRRMFWKVRATPRATTCWVLSPRSDFWPRVTSPWYPRTTPETALNSVVLPAPLGPITPRISPLYKVKETSETAWTPPKRTPRPASSSSGSDVKLGDVRSLGRWFLRVVPQQPARRAGSIRDQTLRTEQDDQQQRPGEDDAAEGTWGGGEPLSDDHVDDRPQDHSRDRSHSPHDYHGHRKKRLVEGERLRGHDRLLDCEDRPRQTSPDRAGHVGIELVADDRYPGGASGQLIVLDAGPSAPNSRPA